MRVGEAPHLGQAVQEEIAGGEGIGHADVEDVPAVTEPVPVQIELDLPNPLVGELHPQG